MNFNHLSDKEFIHYVDLMSTDDPIVKRLLGINQHNSEILDGLVHAGMDTQSNEFHHEGLDYSPGDYIYRLHRDIEYYDEEYSNLQGELDAAKEKIQKLETRGVASLIAELQSELFRMDTLVQHANKAASIAEEKEANMREKLDMWAILNR